MLDGGCDAQLPHTPARSYSRTLTSQASMHSGSSGALSLQHRTCGHVLHPPSSYSLRTWKRGLELGADTVRRGCPSRAPNFLGMPCGCSDGTAHRVVVIVSSWTAATVTTMPAHAIPSLPPALVLSFPPSLLLLARRVYPEADAFTLGKTRECRRTLLEQDWFRWNGIG